MNTSSNKFLFNPLINILQEYIENPSDSLRNTIIFEMEKTNLSQFTKTLNNLKNEKISLNESSIEIFSNDKNFKTKNILSPVFLNEDNSIQYFSTNKNLYKLENNELSKINSSELTDKNKSILESFNNLNKGVDFVSKIIKGKNIKYSFNDNKFYLNETETSLDQLNKLGYFTFENATYLSDFVNISENSSLFFELDFCKEISSSIIESSIELFKLDKKVYMNK